MIIKIALVKQPRTWTRKYLLKITLNTNLGKQVPKEIRKNIYWLNELWKVCRIFVVIDENWEIYWFERPF